MINFQMPYALILIPILIYIFFRKKSIDSIKVPGTQIIKRNFKTTKKHHLGKFFIFLSLILMTIALARPQSKTTEKIIKKDGVDIVIALDLSKSMEIEDFSPNRLEKSKELLNQFINKRANDRLSLVVFGGEAYTKVPLTFDHSVLTTTISDISTEDITSNNRTAIGMGIGVSLNRLKQSAAKSKVIILMTDGENNSGEMNPISAAEVAKKLGVKIYTVGIGAKEIPVPGFFGTRYIPNDELDENLLVNIATITGGEYFRASDTKEFQNIFNQIDSLEKSEINSRPVYNITEYFEIFLRLALVSLMLGIFFEYFKFIKIP